MPDTTILSQLGASLDLQASSRPWNYQEDSKTLVVVGRNKHDRVQTSESSMLGNTTDDSLQYVPKSTYLTLVEACEMKGLAYKTAMNRPWLRPNGGKPDAIVGGRGVFAAQTIQAWIHLEDWELYEEHLKSKARSNSHLSVGGAE